MDYAHPVIWCNIRSQCIVIYVLCHTCYVWHKVTKCGISPQRYVRTPAGGKRWMVVFLVIQDSINLSSWIFREYLPESHISDAQVVVNIKNLDESLARYLSPKRYAIDYRGSKATHCSTRPVCEPLRVNPGGLFNYRLYGYSRMSH